MAKETDYYTTLGLGADATPEAIRAAFKKYVGDLPKGVDPASQPGYQRFLQAYKVLSDPRRRSVYDALLDDAVSKALNIEMQATRSHLELSQTEQLVYLLINIQTMEQESTTQYPLNLNLVIDRSTSMKGSRLEKVMAAIDMILEKLKPQDVLSVVSFSDRAEVVVPADHVDSKHLVSARIRGIRASGGTEIYHGLAAGVNELQRFPLAEHTNHLILLTDGHTYGDVTNCIELAEVAAKKGIAFSAMGIGTEWNDEFLDQLVQPSGGQSMYVAQPEDILTHLQKQIKGLGQVYARNVRLLTRLPKSLSLQYAYKLAPFAQPVSIERDELNLGNIEGNSPLTLMLEFSVAPQRIDTRIRLPMLFRADIPSRRAKDKAFKHMFQFMVSRGAPKADPSPELVKAVRMLNMCRMNEKAWSDVENGNLDEAANRMRHLSTRLLEMGETQLAQQAHAETQRLSSMGELSAEGRKRLKYGTRALFAENLNQ